MLQAKILKREHPSLLIVLVKFWKFATLFETTHKYVNKGDTLRGYFYLLS